VREEKKVCCWSIDFRHTESASFSLGLVYQTSPMDAHACVVSLQEKFTLDCQSTAVEKTYRANRTHSDEKKDAES
jgi:hypothetical protein